MLGCHLGSRLASCFSQAGGRQGGIGHSRQLTAGASVWAFPFSCSSHTIILCCVLAQATSLLGGPLANQPSYVVGYGAQGSWSNRVHHR